MEETVAEKIGHFVSDLSYDTLPGEVRDKVKSCMINALAIGMSAHRIEFTRMARELVKAQETGIPPEMGATVFCDGSKVTPMGAAFANAALFHARVQEDTVGSSHAGTVVIPSVLALAERDGYPGKRILEAVVSGYEVIGRFDKFVSMHTTPRGFRASPIFGILGSSVASSKVLGLTEEETINALGFAAAFAGGTLESFAAGTVEWRYEVSVASREGMTAALLAKQGARSARTALEGKAGFLKAFAGTTETAEFITRDLGKTWDMMDAGFKLYPVCAFNQTPVRTLLALIKENNLSAQDIKKIQIEVNPYEYHYEGLAFQGPFSSAESALMSTPFCAALVAMEGRVTLNGLYRFNDPNIGEMMKKIEHRPNEKIPTYCCTLILTTKKGDSLRKESTEGPAYYNFNMEQTIELARRVTSEAGLDQDKVSRMIDVVGNLDEALDVKGLADLMGSCHSNSQPGDPTPFTKPTREA